MGHLEHFFNLLRDYGGEGCQPGQAQPLDPERWERNYGRSSTKAQVYLKSHQKRLMSKDRLPANLIGSTAVYLINYHFSQRATLIWITFSLFVIRQAQQFIEYWSILLNLGTRERERKKRGGGRLALRAPGKPWDSKTCFENKEEALLLRRKTAFFQLRWGCVGVRTLLMHAGCKIQIFVMDTPPVKRRLIWGNELIRKTCVQKFRLQKHSLPLSSCPACTQIPAGISSERSGLQFFPRFLASCAIVVRVSPWKTWLHNLLVMTLAGHFLWAFPTWRGCWEDKYSGRRTVNGAFLLELPAPCWEMPGIMWGG